MGCEVPRGIDGRVLTEICLEDRPIFGERDQISQSNQKLERTDEQRIVDRLKKLGYL
jgi:hypothetical protein